jgi:hypothetical protein
VLFRCGMGCVRVGWPYLDALFLTIFATCDE